MKRILTGNDVVKPNDVIGSVWRPSEVRGGFAVRSFSYQASDAFDGG